MVVAILGGTGNLGYSLARRWALSGIEVILGSRNAEKAAAVATEIRNSAPAHDNRSMAIRGIDNVSAAQSAPIAVLTVPFSHQAEALAQVKDALQGKILVDTTAPLVPPRVARVQLPPAGSAALTAQQLLGPTVKVVSAFQNVAAELLRADGDLECDVLVCGNDKNAREQVVKLVEAAGMRGFHAGSLDNAVAAEALTSLLIFINKYYNGHAGIRLTGVENKPTATRSKSAAE